MSGATRGQSADVFETTQTVQKCHYFPQKISTEPSVSRLKQKPGQCWQDKISFGKWLLWCATLISFVNNIHILYSYTKRTAININDNKCGKRSDTDKNVHRSNECNNINSQLSLWNRSRPKLYSRCFEIRMSQVQEVI